MSDVWTPPQAEVKDVGLSGNPEAPEIRRQHLSHEANIKAVGMLYYLSAIGLLIAGVVLLISAAAGGKAETVGAAIGMAVAALAFGGFYFWVGRGLRVLKPWSRIVAGVLAGLGLLGFPVGTLISVFILYLLFSKKGNMVFSEEYKQIIADTPDIKYRTSIIVWIFLALLIAFVLFAVFATARH